MTTQTSLAELFIQHDQLLSEAEKLIVDRAEALLAKVPESCQTFVTECFCGYDPEAFAQWLGHLVKNTRNGYGCDGDIHLSGNTPHPQQSFKTSDEALAALKELEEAWKGQISLHPRVVNYTSQATGIVYGIEVLCKAVNA